MILQALDRYYDRMQGRIAPFGYVEQRIGYALVLSPDGEVDEVRTLGDDNKKKAKRTFLVPAPITEPKARTAGSIVPYFLWDKPSYLLGIETGETNTEKKYAASRTLHLRWLADASDPILIALRKFFERYPSGVPEQLIPLDCRDAPYVIRTAANQTCAHETEEAQKLWLKFMPRSDAEASMCLVTGSIDRIARLHPKIGGFKDADTLVAFDKQAFESYGKEQGANAPTSEAAAFRYGAALNRMLDRGSRNRIPRPIGDATVVFWADASGLEKSTAEAVAAASEDHFAKLFEPPVVDTPAVSEADDESEAAKLRDALQKVAQGRPACDVFPDIPEGVRFYILGLSPNAARLSVRFWLADTFQHFVDRLGAHWRDLAIEPKPRGWVNPPAVQRLLVRTTALQEKFENIPPLLAGEVMRAVLGGTLYPRTLLTAALTRLRAGDDPGSGWHAAVIKACLNRPFERELEQLRREEPTPARDARIARIEQEKLPVALEPDREDAAYQLGRLFAVLESAQYAALGRVNAPIGDRYYAAASATPARVFGTLLRGLKTHVADARKRGQGGWIEPKVATIMAKLPPELPKTLRLEDQGRFAVGYYHERATRFGQGAEPENTETTGETSDEQ